MQAVSGGGGSGFRPARNLGALGMLIDAAESAREPGPMGNWLPGIHQTGQVGRLARKMVGKYVSDLGGHLPTYTPGPLGPMSPEDYEEPNPNWDYDPIQMLLGLIQHNEEPDFEEPDWLGGLTESGKRWIGELGAESGGSRPPSGRPPSTGLGEGGRGLVGVGSPGDLLDLPPFRPSEPTPEESNWDYDPIMMLLRIGQRVTNSDDPDGELEAILRELEPWNRPGATETGPVRPPSEEPDEVGWDFDPLQQLTGDRVYARTPGQMGPWLGGAGGVGSLGALLGKISGGTRPPSGRPPGPLAPMPPEDLVPPNPNWDYDPLMMLLGLIQGGGLAGR